MRQVRWIVFLGCFFLAVGVMTPDVTAAQEPAAIPHADATSEVTAGSRFFAAHGRRALISGYGGKGAEVWAYPFQILRDYRIAFRLQGAANFLAGDGLLARIEYHPDRIVRVYLGPGFVVHETLFVPPDDPGAIFIYKVQSREPLEIAVNAQPVLDLMWPGAIGGQGLNWDKELHVYRISEPKNGWSALVGSRQTAGHDEVKNRTQGGTIASGIGLILHPDAAGEAVLAVALEGPGSAGGDAAYRKLLDSRGELERQSAEHAKSYGENVLRISTPDAQVNAALDQAVIALDQSWVCSTELGCGLVAGFGPSRDARRPQYDWFFAGDGLVGEDALLDLGDFAGARRELDFILRYQDAKTGMVWHEMSQSAPFIDWVRAYPYMYAHVDITFQFMEAAARYVKESGDKTFVREHWQGLDATYRYCRSLLDSRDGLPRIPEGKEGGNEQDRLTDELSLSSAWVKAAEGFAQMAAASGHVDRKIEAEQAAQRARKSIALRYWDAEQKFPISGYTASGKPSVERRSAAADPEVLDLLDASAKQTVLDELAGSDFQSDWGTRTISASSSNYQPDSYAQGSVFALGTASTASAFWAEHRPAAAYQVWHCLTPWSSLDSPGHMHEVLAGDVYRPGMESVPEQMWSSASYISAFVQGMLALDMDAAKQHVSFAPHLPAEWDAISIDRIRLGEALLSFQLRREATGLSLRVENPGQPLQLNFSPQIPLGAKIVRAQLNRMPIQAALAESGEDAHAFMSIQIPHGESEISLELQGGAEAFAADPAPRLGEPSKGIHIVSAKRQGNRLVLIVDHLAGREAQVHLRTGESIGKVEGASLRSLGSTNKLLVFQPYEGLARVGGYLRTTATIDFGQSNEPEHPDQKSARGIVPLQQP